ncbi:MAG: hypothetical protein ACYCQI_05215 [Gammaproteobacteria bacterium]
MVFYRLFKSRYFNTIYLFLKDKILKTVIKDVLFSAGAKELAGLVMDYYRSSMIKETEEVTNPSMIVKNQIFSAGAKSTAAANITDLVMEYYDDEEMTNDNEKGRALELR